jgi:hypothetical protein
MLTKHTFRRIALAAVSNAIIAVPCLAQILAMRDYHGKQVTCTYSGLRGVASICGTEHYVRVFTGTVTSAVETNDTEAILKILPDEVFAGDYDQATAVVNEACLKTEIRAGDRWLFYLSHDPKADMLVLSYNSPSKPVAEAQDDISTLRDLQHMTDEGILVGIITDETQTPPFSNRKVVAKNVKTAAEYSAQTNDRGYFKFDLPGGTYDVFPAAEYGLVEAQGVLSQMKGSIAVSAQRCYQHDFSVTLPSRLPPPNDASISGHLFSPDGKPLTVHPWVQMVSTDGQIYKAAYVNADGNFEAKDVKPGRYLVGLGIQKGTGSFSDVPTAVYYPGVSTKDQATVIEVRAGEKRANVDFQLPAEDVLKPLVHATSEQ